MRIETPQTSAVLEEALDALDEGLVIFDRDRKLVLANRCYAEMLGPHKTALVPGATMEDIIAPAVASGHITILRGAERGMPAFFADLETLEKSIIEVLVSDGTHREITLTRLSDSSLVANVKDVTAKRATEAQARELLNEAIAAVDFGIALIGDDENLIFANQKFREIADPDNDYLKPGLGLGDICKKVISSEIFQSPIGVSQSETADELQSLVRNTAKGFSLTSGRGREIVGSAYETVLRGKLLTLEDVTDQLRAERLFTDAVARLPVGLAIEGSDGKLSHCNDAFSAPFGYTAQGLLELIDTERFATLAPQIASIEGVDVGTHGKELFAEAVKEQRKTLQPMELYFRNGRHYLVERAITEDEGRVIVATDTTALKQAEQRSLRTLNDTIQSLEEGLAVFDENSGFLLANKRWRELFFGEIPFPEIGETLLSILQRVIGGGCILSPAGTSVEDYASSLDQAAQAFEKKETIHLSDGKIVLASAHPTQRNGYLLSFVDVTEQRRAELEQREADLLLHKIVEACPANFLVSRVDDGKVIYCPPPSRERFGNITSTLSFFLNPDDRQKYLDALLPTGVLDDYRVEFRRADGSVMQGLTAARVTEYKGEKVIVSSTRDISDLLSMQEELQQQRDAAHQTEKLSALGELLAGVAHELNNPLSIIVGYAQMLEGKIDDRILSKRVDRIAEAADRSARIVRAFLAMARQRPTKIEPCSLNDIALTALDVAGYGLRTNGTEVRTDLDDDLPDISGDADQLVQVMSNLIVNAEHALAPLGESGILTIRTFWDKKTKQSVLEFKDNGPGIPEAIQARIFEPFFTTKDVGKGTGIGLAFSHRIIDAHGGRLELVSEQGGPTSFFIRLDTNQAIGAARSAGCQISEALPGKLVLVIDDEENVGELICDMLEEVGFDPVLLTNARAALDLLAHETFDAVLSDFKMPGMDGAQFYQAILDDLPSYASRVGFVTGDTLGKDVYQFFSETARPHIEKPIVSEELSRLVKRLCDEGHAT